MKKLFCVFICTCMLSACSESIDLTSTDVDNPVIELSEDEIASIAFDNPRILNENAILGMVNDFISSVVTKTRSTENPKATIAGKYYLKGINSATTRGIQSENDSIPLYHVCITDGENTGYAIVSADERNAGVIAYVAKGDYEKREATGAGMMLKLSEITLLSEISKIEMLKTTLREKTISKVAGLLGKESVTCDEIRALLQSKNSITRSPAYDWPQSFVRSLVRPVLITKWGQETPYNLYLPTCYNSWGGEDHYPAGCGIIAGAQALAAVATSNITINNVAIDWRYLGAQVEINYDSYFGGDATGMNMVATLIKDMYEKTGTTPVINTDFEYQWYHDTSIPAVSSSSTSSLNLMNYLKKYVSCGTYYSKYAPDPLITTLNVNQKIPCVAIMGGTHAATSESGKGSHAWVIDGYALCNKTTIDLLTNYDLYFHANMGWYGTDNGYYKVNSDTTTDFETALGTYNLNFWEITEIHG